MLYKKFGRETYESLPDYKYYKLEDTDELLLVDKKYTVLKQGKLLVI